MMLPARRHRGDIARLSALYGPRQVHPRAVRDLAGGRPSGATSAPPSTAASRCSTSSWGPPSPARSSLGSWRWSHAVALGGARAAGGTRLRSTRTEGGLARGQRRGPFGPRLPLGAPADPPLRRPRPRLPHLGPRQPFARAGVPDAVLPFRGPSCACASTCGGTSWPWPDAALALACPLAAIIGQLLKQSLKETMHLDYVTLAR
jgi:peptide/nickel transport system permease protein